jgi:hypothetical protein
MQRMGYEKNGPIGKRKEGIVDRIQLSITHPKDKIGLGYSGDTKEASLKQSHEEEILKQSHEEIILQQSHEMVLKLQDSFDIDTLQPIE